jgi:hypothetical protein
VVLPRLTQRALMNARGLFALAGLVLLLDLGCGRKVDVQGKTAELETAFPGVAAVTPASLSAARRPGSGDPRAFVSAALAASRTNDWVTAVIMVDAALQAPGVTPQQVMSLQATRKTWMTDLMIRADKGDVRAKAALVAIERSH